MKFTRAIFLLEPQHGTTISTKFPMLSKDLWHFQQIPIFCCKLVCIWLIRRSSILGIRIHLQIWWVKWVDLLRQYWLQLLLCLPHSPSSTFTSVRSNKFSSKAKRREVLNLRKEIIAHTSTMKKTFLLN